MTLHLFEGYGVEIEYMIVDAGTLDVRPLADQVLGGEAEIDSGALAWSNELVLHVIELKTNGPAPDLAPLADLFQRDVGRIDEALTPLGARLMPTGMHPWMSPGQARLWPHEYTAVYRAFDRLFSCRQHGWSNLQSTHINLPFCGDEEFGRLHAAVRLVLPLLPALAASSPLQEGRPTGLLDTRLEHYRNNSRSIPLVAGDIVPEPVYTRTDYEALLSQIYDAVPERVLHHEWVNARGAIARFDRNAIEIRLLDVQECPAADLAIVELVVATLRSLVEERWSSTADQKQMPTAPLATILRETLRSDAQVSDETYLELLGLNRPMSAHEIWLQLASALGHPVPRLPLAQRILTALETESVHQVYGRLCDCLRSGEVFN
ncbi:MAG: glutamate-cysteine ligase family protein [Gemmatimonadota bacterium]|nr:glutamate-cysteine ligase family protein [Gemmatimonadota bacterium]MDH3427182.1 glutamate-cysteine ligase family protein [Gemmatimonadota bacterium]